MGRIHKEDPRRQTSTSQTPMSTALLTLLTRCSRCSRAARAARAIEYADVSREWRGPHPTYIPPAHTVEASQASTGDTGDTGEPSSELGRDLERAHTGDPKRSR
eukprot:CAMPEP_0181185946 /NCGR_PEP_ID=MMETSP1096-20121128/9778_1 /TAXON_ID=156174 ORGANISM="Chrysochromulina ericina, Strain CCMP281" /NCGR_SAMPLE_ID=MMETSP1096 /ASSEMBLY_ACC=CAM_ASM_000453 /LENGTH=103 /DNA_ID=CAMNT_0023274823 /DNA_START=694 /DNA_END=1001 /DNA_ORIENTATION=+